MNDINSDAPHSELLDDSGAVSPNDKALAIFSACFVVFAGSIIFNLLPIYLGLVAERFSLSANDVGTLGSIALAGFAIASVTAPLWIVRISPPRYCTIFMALSCASIFIAAFTKNTEILTLLLGIAGLMGGAAFACAIDALDKTRKKERNFAFSILVVQLTSAGTIFLMSALPSLRSFSSMTFLMAGLVAIGAVLSPFISSRPSPGQLQLSSSMDQNRKTILLPIAALIALGMFGIGIVGVWAFLERMASSAGLSNDNIYQALAQAYIAGAVGAFLASMIADRVGRIIPLVLASIALTVTLFIAPQYIAAGSFLMMVLIFQLSWNFTIPYQFSIISNVDPSSRMLVMAPAFQAFGAVFGPVVAGLIASENNFTPVLLFGAIMVTASALIYIICETFVKKSLV